jgi:hypothetical protein
VIRKISELAAHPHPDKPALPDQQGVMNNELGVDQEGEFGRATEAVPELTSNDPKPVLARLKLAFDYTLLRGEKRSSLA